MHINTAYFTKFNTGMKFSFCRGYIASQEEIFVKIDSNFIEGEFLKLI